MKASDRPSGDQDTDVRLPGRVAIVRASWLATSISRS